MGAALVLAGGAALAATLECETVRPCYGTNKPDTLRGTDGPNFMYGRGGGDTLKGGGDSDSLGGGPGRDRLYGGPGRDHLSGDRGGDTLAGGGDGDSYFMFREDWRNDRIIDTATPGDDFLADNKVSFNNFDGEDTTEGLVVDLNSDSGPLPEVQNESASATINWDGDVIDKVVNFRQGNDTIRGNGAANWVLTSGGEDTVSGGGGDDEVDVGDGVGGDTVECGDGNDTVYRDPPDPANNDPGDTVSADCEVQEDPPFATPDG